MSSLLNFRVEQTALPQNYSSIKMHGLHVSTCSLRRCGFSNMCTKIMWAGEGGKVNVTLFSILLRNKFSKSFLYLINPRKYAYFFKPRLCCMFVGSWWSVIQPYLGGRGGGGGERRLPWQLTAGMKGDLSAGCRLPTLWRCRKNRMVKNCNIYRTRQYVVVTYFSSLRPCI